VRSDQQTWNLAKYYSCKISGQKCCQGRLSEFNVFCEVNKVLIKKRKNGSVCEKLRALGHHGHNIFHDFPDNLSGVGLKGELDFNLK